MVQLLNKRLGRRLIVAKDRPAFAGNRVAFKVLNEVAQLVPGYGVVFLDYLIGPHTGRAMAPLATIDLVGWDVHEAIVDNVYAGDARRGACAVQIAGLYEGRRRARAAGRQDP